MATVQRVAAWLFLLAIIPCSTGFSTDVEIRKRIPLSVKTVPAKVVLQERVGPLRRAALGRFKVKVVPKQSTPKKSAPKSKPAVKPGAQ